MAKKRKPRVTRLRHKRRSHRATSSTPTHKPTKGLYGWITHTDIGSSDPAATKKWCEAVLGWTFKPSVPMQGGEYHLFAYSQQGGGGIHQARPSEMPGTIPYIHVADAEGAFEHALREGAEQVSPPTRVMEGVTTAVVRAPGGVVLGFSGP
jgi:predicted enzyme related to lactoylglutathione lyase